MKWPAVYVLGGAGTGKSTFVGQLLNRLGWQLEPLIELHVGKTARDTRIALRGHRARGGEGVYIGKMRDQFPGTDGLDRACGPVGAAWLDSGGLAAPCLAEGATLSGSTFLGSLARNTDLLVVLLEAAEFVVELRCWQRGSNQDAGFLKASATRSTKAWDRAVADGARGLRFDSADPVAWQTAQEVCEKHLRIV